MAEYKRKMPHFQPEQRYLFVTWRLDSSLPRHVSYNLYPTEGRALAAHDKALAADPNGPRWLEDPAIAGIVANAIRHGADGRGFYELDAWVVMPNHVHVLILPYTPMPTITRWLKGSTARAANRLLGRTGYPFWQDESYDHYVRDQREFERIGNYIEFNPVSAGLAVSAELWRCSSAHDWQAEGPALPTV
jgi:putative transposase